MDRNLSFFLLGALTLAGLVVFFIKAGTPAPFDVTQACLTSETYHVHAHLTIVINGEKQVVPKGVGIISPTCIRPLHTHDTDNIIHIEFERPRNFTLGEFFRVWGVSFSRDRLGENRVDSTHTLAMTVNGQPNTDFENLVLSDKQEIVIAYAEKQ